MNPSHNSHTNDRPPTLRFNSALSKRRAKSVSTIVAALIVTAVVTAIVGVTFIATNAASRMGYRATSYIATQRAAEAAVEYGYGIWKQRVFTNNGAIGTNQANLNITAPSMPGFEFDTVANNGPLALTATDEYGAPAAAPVPTVVNLTNYPGWRGFSYGYLVSAKVKSSGQVGTPHVAGVRRRFQYTEVPIFQMMYFFQDNLEFYKPANMIIGGLVHTNSNLYASASSAGVLTFTGNVSYAGTYTNNSAPPGGASWSSWSSDAPPTYPNGESNQVTKVPVAQPMGLSLTAVFNTTDSNPNNDGYRELIEQPQNTAVYPDPPEIAARRVCNKAGILMTINGTTVTVTTQNGTTATAPQIATLKTAFTGKTTLYDQREGKTADVANIDVSKLTPTLNALSSSGFNGVIYIVDNTPVTTSGASPSPNAKTIRLQNGGVLPNNGLTLASENPVYIQGDYNTGTSATNPSTSVPANSTGNPTNSDSPTVPGYTRKSSAVMGDAVMFLSNNWNDANAPLTVVNRLASNTTYNTAIMAGFMPSQYTPPSGSQYGYSGGGNNFPRFLETWTAKTCTYYGSMVELFQSKTYTGKWDTGNIYTPPSRRWNFDTNFSTSAPPGSFILTVYSRGSWSKF